MKDINWQLYDLEADPFELQDLFELPNQEQHKKLNGPLKEIFLKEKSDLKRASEKYFVAYVKEEMRKEYRPPRYPLKMWTSIFLRYRPGGTFMRSKMLQEINFVHPDYKPVWIDWVKNGQKRKKFTKNVLNMNYCADLSALRQKINNLTSHPIPSDEKILQDFKIIDEKRIKMYL